jgi:signal transduction histidine kinase/FixJ family two-component response regulator
VQPTVLVIDDSPATLNLVAAYLAAVDVRTLLAFCGEEGLAVARAERPDLVLCDIVLPDRDGYSVLAALRADPALEDTPVVLMTGVSAQVDRTKAINGGADDLLTKPFDRAELTTRVKALLRLKAREDAVHRANAQLRERVYLLSTLFVVGNHLRDSLDPQDVFRVIRDTLQVIVGADQFSIYTRDDDGALDLGPGGPGPGSPDRPDRLGTAEAPSRFRLVVAHGVPTAPQSWDANTAGEPMATVVATGQPYYHSGPAETRPTFQGRPLSAVVPLMADREVIGLISLNGFAPERGDAPDFELVAMLSTQVAGAIHALRLRRELGEYAGRLTEAGEVLEQTRRTLEDQMFHRHTLMLFSAQIHGANDVAQTLDAVRDLLLNFVGAASYRLVYFDRGESHVIRDHAPGYGAEMEPQDWLRLVDRVMLTGEPVFDPNSDVFGVIPLLLGGEPRGALLIESLLPHKVGLTADDMELLSLLAQHVAIALFSAYARERQEARRRDFYAMLAHDLRSPLATQSLGFQMLEDSRVGPLNEEQMEIVKTAVTLNRRLLGLVEDFLAFSQIEGGALQLQREPADLVALVRETVEEMRRLLDSRQQTLQLDLPDYPVELDVDRPHLKRVIANLLSNAQKYTPVGGHVVVSLKEQAAEVIVEVKDNGPGIPAAEQPRLFKRYYRIQDERRHQEGTGLGLLIVKEVVEAHGGRVWVESAGVPGQGSTFGFALPR